MNEFRYDKFEWPNEKSGSLNKDYSIDDYLIDMARLKSNFGIDVKGLVYVQVYHNEKETGFGKFNKKNHKLLKKQVLLYAFFKSNSFRKNNRTI